jgi:hypothetical protein
MRPTLKRVCEAAEDAIMRWRSTAMSVLASLLCATSAQAGVYSSVEPPFHLNEKDYRAFREQTLIPLKRIGTTQDMVEWQKCYTLAGKALKYLKDAPPKGVEDPFTVEDRLNMSACLMRMRDPLAAIEVLRPATLADPANFVVMSNFGTAYLLAGDYDRAVVWLSIADHYWRKPYFDLKQERRSRDLVEFLNKVRIFTEHEHGWYAKCEKYQYRLARLRNKELGGGKDLLDFARSLTKLDELFDPMPSFVGPNGKFEAGRIAAAEQKKLPSDAMLVVQQLQIWMPEDLRLIWLAGELLNANNDIPRAQEVLSEFLSRYADRPENKGFGVKMDPMQLRAKFAKKFPAIAERLEALDAYTPVLPDMKEEPQPAKKVELETAGKKPATPTDDLKVDWKTLGVGFSTGVFAGLLVMWQWRELVRRRQARKAAGPVPASWQASSGASTSTVPPEKR